MAQNLTMPCDYMGHGLCLDNTRYWRLPDYIYVPQNRAAPLLACWAATKSSKPWRRNMSYQPESCITTQNSNR
eukprot:3909808-Amphidinium_carterae.1